MASSEGYFRAPKPKPPHSLCLLLISHSLTAPCHSCWVPGGSLQAASHEEGHALHRLPLTHELGAVHQDDGLQAMAYVVKDRVVKGGKQGHLKGGWGERKEGEEARRA